MPNAQQILKMTTLSEEELKTHLSINVTDEDMYAYFGKHADVVRACALSQDDLAKRGDSLIVLLPGLMGSVLENIGEEPEVIWINPLAFLRGHLNHLDLAPDGKASAIPGVHIAAPNAIWLVYAKMLLRLKHAFEVCIFPYDWRRATDDIASKLKEFIDQQLAISPHSKVTLIGHSLGGLVILDYLARQATQAHAEKHVQRAITLGTPFRGTIEAVTSIAKADDPKMKLARKLNRNNDPGRMMLSCPSVYQILPAPHDLYPGWQPTPMLDIWNPATWKAAGISVNTAHLAQAKAHHHAIADADPQVPFYCVVGVYYDTPVKLPGDILTAIPQLIREGIQGGDGTVEVSSAIFKDRPAYFVHEVHVELVLETEVITAIMDWVEGSEPSGLVTNIDDVALDDTPLRGFEMIDAGTEINYDDVVHKIESGEPLSREEIQALTPVM